MKAGNEVEGESASAQGTAEPLRPLVRGPGEGEAGKTPRRSRPSGGAVSAGTLPVSAGGEPRAGRAGCCCQRLSQF